MYVVEDQGFLVGRSQRVGVDGIYSDSGECPRTIIFVIFINENFIDIVNSLCHIYANDTNVFGKVERKSVAKLQQDLTV